MKAQEIIDMHIVGWDQDRDLYLLTEEEMSVLISELGIHPIIKENGDNTYYYEVKVGEKRFCCSGKQKIGGRQL